MNDTEKNLLAAFQNYDNADTIQYNYRIYYDALTGECLYTDVLLHDDPYIEVDKDTFTNFNPIFYRVVNGKIKPRQVNYSDKRILVLGEGTYKTIKGASMFLVNKNETLPCVTWKINDDN